MRIEFEKDVLLHGLDLIRGIPNPRSQNPIHGNILIAAEGSVQLSATDSEMGAQVHVHAVVHEEGSISLPAKRLSDLVRTLPDTPIIFELRESNNSVKITADKGRHTISGSPADQFPEMPSLESRQNPISTDSHALQNAIKRTVFAAAGESYPNMDAIQFIFSPEYTEAVATNRFMIARATFDPIENSDEERESIVVPRKAINEMLKTFSASAEMTIWTSGSQALFSDGSNTLVARLQDASEYPSVKVFVESNYETYCIVEKTKLLNLIRRVSVLANPKNNLVILNIEGDEIVAECKTPELGDSVDSMALKSCEGSVRIGISARFLLSSLNNIDTETVRIEFNKPSDSLIIRSTSEDIIDRHDCFILPVAVD